VTAVTTAINQLVSRLNLTLDRERLFTADVAHELRTPLAGLRLHLELLAKVHGVSVDPLIQRLDQMTNSITQLLQLARVGQSFSAGSYQQVALKEDVVEPLQSELETMLQQRQQTLAINVKDGEASCRATPRWCRLFCAIWWKTRIAIARRGRRLKCR
jgi:two-component system sensor histidine kinase BasS